MMKFFLVFLILVTGCTLQAADNIEDADMKNVVSAQIADLVRSTAQGTINGLPFVAPEQQRVALQQSGLEPGEYTVQFQAFPPADNKGFAAYAVITWKIAGQQTTRKVSVASGVSVSGVADSVDVYLVDVSGTGVAGFPPNTPNPNPTGIGLYKIGVALSKGTRPNVQQPATLVTAQGAQQIGQAVTVQYVVPPDAGVTSVMVLASRSSNADTINSTDIIAGQIPASNAALLGTWYPIQANSWVPLIEGCTIINVQNFSAGPNNAFAQVIWGIDG